MSGEGTHPDWIAACLALVRKESGSQVVLIGDLPAAVYDRGWSNRATDACVLIKERRRHYLQQHSDLDPEIHEPLLLIAVVSPHEVHRNVRDPRIAIVYQELPGTTTHRLRIAIWISNDPALRNSVHSMRIARLTEMFSGRRAGRKVWP